MWHLLWGRVKMGRNIIYSSSVLIFNPMDSWIGVENHDFILGIQLQCISNKLGRGMLLLHFSWWVWSILIGKTGFEFSSQLTQCWVFVVILMRSQCSQGTVTSVWNPHWYDESHVPNSSTENWLSFINQRQLFDLICWKIHTQAFPLTWTFHGFV